MRAREREDSIVTLRFLAQIAERVVVPFSLGNGVSMFEMLIHHSGGGVMEYVCMYDSGV